MRSRSAGHTSASFGIMTAGRRTPHAIGIAARSLRRNVMFDVTPTSEASSIAIFIHGASSTRSLRRAIH